ncbi:MAG: ABC transporter ATP-binding protein [Phycisphaerae bacterium]
MSAVPRSKRIGENGTPLVEARELWKTYHVGEIDVPAVCGVSLSIPAGQFLSVMGASGSGKSTFMHMIGCLDRCDRGRYALAGTEVTALSRRELALLRNRKIGFVFQSFNLLPRTSALDNVALPLSYRGVRRRLRRQQAAAMLERVGLADRSDHHPNQLSGGQQQRVAIARALITEPLLLLADEPTGNLDSRTGIEIMALLQELNRDTGLTIVLVTHEPDIAAYTRRAVTFRDGHVASDVLSGNVREAVPPDAPPVVAALTPS